MTALLGVADRPDDAADRVQVAAGPRTPDPTLLALQTLVGITRQVAQLSEDVAVRAAHIRACRLDGRPYREIVSGEDLPLIARLLPDTIHRLETASTRFRQAEAAALHEEGMTMEEIGRLFGLTRQRISALIRGAAAAPTGQVGDHDAAPPPTRPAREHQGEPVRPSP